MLLAGPLSLTLNVRQKATEAHPAGAHLRHTGPSKCKSMTVDGNNSASSSGCCETASKADRSEGCRRHAGFLPPCNVDWQNFLRADTLHLCGPTLQGRGGMAGLRTCFTPAPREAHANELAELCPSTVGGRVAHVVAWQQLISSMPSRV